jgi:hypothetical protein
MAVDPDLASTERILQRWAAAVAGGVPDLRAHDNDPGATPLWPDLTPYVDRDYLRAPKRLRAVVKQLYRKHATYEAAATVLGCTRPMVYQYEREALWYFRGTFAANGILARFEQRVARVRRQREARAATVLPLHKGKRSRAPAAPARERAPPDAEHGTADTDAADRVIG